MPSIPPPCLSSKHVILRFSEVYEADAIVSFLIENETHLAPWEPLREEDYFTTSYWKLKIDQHQKDFRHGLSCCFTLYDKDDRTIIGMVNYTNVVRGAFHSCFLGFRIGEVYQGKGLMTEALKTSIPFVFGPLNLHRISANYMPRNQKTARVIEKCGFQKEGLAKGYLQIAGRWEEHILTSLINEHWIAPNA